MILQSFQITNSIIAIAAWISAVGGLAAQQVASPPRETHGEQQVRRMREDRFHMSAYAVEKTGMRLLTSDDAIVKWAVSQFEQRPNGYLVYWNPEPPKTPPTYLADHSSPTKDSLGFISVAKFFPDGPSKGQYVDFEHLWMLAAFELYNIEETKAWEKLDQKVIDKQISKSEYIMEAARIEFKVLHRLKKFHDDVWVPWATAANFRSDSSIWRLDTPAKFDDWIKQYSDTTGYPWVPFGDRYEFFNPVNEK